jgi:SAM-dependent methyltransferase
LNLLFEIHKDLPREAPGDDASTLRALSLLGDRSPDARVLDIGCGPGMQTLAIAGAVNRPVVAIDTHLAYLRQLKLASDAAGVADRVVPVNGSMFALPFANGGFDVIWSEGAIYILGFERGLRAWRPLLRPSGHVVVSELTWLTETRPAEAVAFWRASYPAMRTIEDNLGIVRATGYREVGHFVLPESSWWTHYYTPLERRLLPLRDRYAEDADGTAQLNEVAQQIDLYRRYPDCYGYVFYAMQSTE